MVKIGIVMFTRSVQPMDLRANEGPVALSSSNIEYNQANWRGVVCAVEPLMVVSRPVMKSASRRLWFQPTTS